MICRLSGTDPSGVSQVEEPRAISAFAGLSLAELKHRVRTDRTSFELRYHLARAIAGTGDQEQTLRAWRKALVLQPDSPTAGLHLSEALFGAGEHDEAIDWLKRLIARRPDDDGLKIATIGLCLRSDARRFARWFAEQFLETPKPSPRLSMALAHVFRLFDDHHRAGRAAQVSTDGADLDARQRVLATQIADWNGDVAAALGHRQSLARAVPSGATYARWAMALSRSGDPAGAANAVGSALQFFAADPDQISDLAALLTSAQMSPLRDYVLTSLTARAASDRNAAVALALAHYRLGNWRATKRMLDDDPSLGEHPLLAIAGHNIGELADAGHAPPVRVTDHALRTGLLRRKPRRRGPHGRGGSGSADAVVMILLSENGPDVREQMLLRLASREAAQAGRTVVARQVAAAGLDAEFTADAGYLSGCFFGIPDYQLISKPSAQSGHDTPVPADSELGFLSPAGASEVLLLRQAMEPFSDLVLQTADPGLAVSAGLAMVDFPNSRLMLHVAESWFTSDAGVPDFFDAAMAALLDDRRVRCLANHTGVAEAVHQRWGDGARISVIPDAVDVRATRRGSGGIGRLRAGEGMSVRTDKPLVSVVGAGAVDQSDGFSGVPDMRDAADLVVWHPGGTPAAASASSPGPVLAWPNEPGPFLAHASLALAWHTTGDHETILLDHVAMSVPILRVGGSPGPDGAGSEAGFPDLGSVMVDELAERLRLLLSRPDHLAEVGEAARLWARKHRNLDRAARQLGKLYRR